MKSKILKILILTAIFIVMINSLVIFYPRGTFYERWDEFYKIEDQTLDVVFLGSSHTYSAYVPTIFNEQLQVDTYNLSSAGQTLDQTYYYLKELYKSQSPKVVVLETFSYINLFENPKKKDEYTHHSFDEMRLSKNKIDAITASVENKEDRIKFYLPFIEHHTNWKDEDINNRIDFYFSSENTKTDYFGYLPRKYVFGTVEGENYIIPLKMPEPEMPDDIYIDYFEKILKLCEQNNTEVIVTSVYYKNQVVDGEDYIYLDYLNELLWIEDYCKANNIDFIDYNRLADSLGLDYTHLSDSGHLNMEGARITSEHFAQYLKDNYNNVLSECTWDLKEESCDEQEKFLLEYDAFMLERESILKENHLELIAYTNNVIEYLRNINDDRYIIMISSKNNSFRALDDEILAELYDLGLQFEIEKGKAMNYIAVIDGDDIYEDIGIGKLTIESVAVQKKYADDLVESKEKETFIEDISLPFEVSIISSGIDSGGMCSIKIDGKEYSRNKVGLNFVIYDKYLKKIINNAFFNINSVPQYHFDRDKAEEKFDENNIIYRLDTSKELTTVSGIKEISYEDDGIYINVLSTDPWFNLDDYADTAQHVIVKAEIYCSNAAVMDVRFNNTYERAQLVSGDNTIFIEINLDTPIETVRIDPADTPGEYIIKSIEICELD